MVSDVVPGRAQAVADQSAEAGGEVIAVNVTGIYLAWRIAAKWMIANDRRGTLLATTSAASFAAYPGFPMYAASKAAGDGLVRAAALELGKYGIRANALCPTHGMSVNVALPPDAKVLDKAYEEIIFPTDLGESDDITSGALPEEVRAELNR